MKDTSTTANAHPRTVDAAAAVLVAAPDRAEAALAVALDGGKSGSCRVTCAANSEAARALPPLLFESVIEERSVEIDICAAANPDAVGGDGDVDKGVRQKSKGLLRTCALPQVIS